MPPRYVHMRVVSIDDMTSNSGFQFLKTHIMFIMAPSVAKINNAIITSFINRKR